MVVMSPEIAVGKTVRNLLLSNIYRKKLCLIAFDEALCISEWYVIYNISEFVQ